MQTKSILKWALILSIVVVLNLFFNFAIATVYDNPQYDDFCGASREQVVVSPSNQNQCVEAGGQWSTNVKPLPAGEPAGWCDVDFTCRQDFEEANSVYNRNVFMVLVVLGLASLLIGTYVVSAGSAVALGLSLGGFLSFVIASMRYWSDMDEYLRVIVLGLALVLLIWLGIKKFKD